MKLHEAIDSGLPFSRPNFTTWWRMRDDDFEIQDSTTKRWISYGFDQSWTVDLRDVLADDWETQDRKIIIAPEDLKGVLAQAIEDWRGSDKHLTTHLAGVVDDLADVSGEG